MIVNLMMKIWIKLYINNNTIAISRNHTTKLFCMVSRCYAVQSDHAQRRLVAIRQVGAVGRAVLPLGDIERVRERLALRAHLGELASQLLVVRVKHAQELLARLLELGEIDLHPHLHRCPHQDRTRVSATS